MSGETDLTALMRTMQARLAPETYVFVTQKSAAIPAGVQPRMIFEEAEGTTFILTRGDAEKHDLPFEFPCRMVTLDVHSALEAVGFIARIASALAQHDMGVNPVAGFYHDHLFVPADRADDAMKILSDMRRAANTAM